VNIMMLPTPTPPARPSPSRWPWRALIALDSYFHFSGKPTHCTEAPAATTGAGRYPAIAVTAARLRARSFTIDGEAVGAGRTASRSSMR
jgi:hypothetical protein